METTASIGLAHILWNNSDNYINKLSSLCELLKSKYRTPAFEDWDTRLL